jgi:hypothetical protein
LPRRFDVFVTIDRLLAERQAIPSRLAVITLVATSNRLTDLLPLVPRLRVAIEAATAGQRTRITR